MSHMMQPRVILLREGTDTSQGKGQLISNINACEAVVDILKTTLGPRGMDKLIHQGERVTISNDGATIIKLLDIVHPAAKTLVDIAKSQDDEVGDGTTSVCLLAGEFLKQAKPFVEDGVHPQIIINAYRQACMAAIDKIKQIHIEIDRTNEVQVRDMLMKCASTALNSKLISGYKDFFAKMAVDAVLHLDYKASSSSSSIIDLQLIGMKKVPGGSVTDSILVEGVAFKKTFAYAGFEQQPKKFTNPKIVCLNVELELKAERQNAEIRLSDPKQYQSIVDAEWQIIYNKLDKIVESGAQIVLSKLPIGDLATQYFADRNIFCAGRVSESDLLRVSKATGAVVQTSLSDLSSSILGTCQSFEERQIGSDRYNFFTGCPVAKTCSIVLRGGSEQFIAESERSLHDALMIVKRALTHQAIVGGGGAIEMELAKYLKHYSKTIQSKVQMIIGAYAKALETIPRQLAENAGFDSTDTLNLLREKHSKDGRWYGVDIENDGIINTVDNFIWEPSLVKLNALSAATEAACMILSIDETVRNPQSEGLNDDRPAPAPRR